MLQHTRVWCRNYCFGRFEDFTLIEVQSRTRANLWYAAKPCWYTVFRSLPVTTVQIRLSQPQVLHWQAVCASHEERSWRVCDCLSSTSTCDHSSWDFRKHGSIQKIHRAWKLFGKLGCWSISHSFVITCSTACALTFFRPVASRPMKWRTLSPPHINCRHRNKGVPAGNSWHLDGESLYI